MLSIKHLTAKINDKVILSNVSLDVHAGECLLVTGHNGSGKSTLLHTIMARPDIETSGSIAFNHEDISKLECYERARLGLFIAHQASPTLDGIKTASLLHEIAKVNPGTIKKVEVIKSAKDAFSKLSLPEDWLRRDFNSGASGGERKKNEIAQARMFKPKVLLLDEPDSGLEQSSRIKVIQLIEEVRAEGGIVILVSHDKTLQDQYNDNKIELSNGTLI